MTPLNELTREKILAMEAGREMDAIILEAAYPWKARMYRDAFGDTLYAVDVTAQREGACQMLGGGWERGYDASGLLVDFFGKICPAFSGGIAAALELLDSMASRYHWVIKSPFDEGGDYVVGLTPLGVSGWNGRPDFVAFAKNREEIPLAICRAYLLATLKIGE